MNDKDLISQLNKLSEFKPDSNWKEENRKILLSQISGTKSVEESSVFDILKMPVLIMKSVSQPVLVVFMFMFVFSGGYIGAKVVNNSQPGDSLYSAKIASEKARVALTFDEKEKVRLGIKYAGNRAKEIDRVLTDFENNTDNKEATVKKLLNDFNKEISGIKSRIAKFDDNTVIVEDILSEEVIIEQENQENQENTELAINTEIQSEDSENTMFSASLNKDDKGIKMAENASGSASSDVEEVVEEQIDVLATTSLDLSSTTTSLISDSQSYLDEAEELLDIEDYDATISKLEEASKVIIDNTQEAVSSSTPDQSDDDGEVLGEDESAEVVEDIDTVSTSSEEIN